MNEVKNEATTKTEEEVAVERKGAELRVGSKTNVKSLASAITATMKEHGYALLRCIGDGAIGRAARASTIARGNLALADINLIMTGSFFMTEIDGNERTGFQIRVENR